MALEVAKSRVERAVVHLVGGELNGDMQLMECEDQQHRIGAAMPSSDTQQSPTFDTYSVQPEVDVTGDRFTRAPAQVDSAKSLGTTPNCRSVTFTSDGAT